MRKVFSAGLLFIGIAAAASAQFSHGPFAGAGYSINGFNTASMNRFTASFNDYYETDMIRPFNDYSLSTMNGFYASLGWRYMKRHKSGFSGCFAYNYGYNSNTKNATIWNGSGYDLNMEFYNHDFVFEGGYQVKGIFFMHALAGISIRHVNLEVWKVYQDGSRSMGYEYDINGFYQLDPSTVEVGGSLGFRAWHFFFPFRVSYGFPLFSTGMLGLHDYDVNRWRSNDFPSDYAAWLANTDGTPDDSNRIPEDDFAGLRFHFGIEFMLPVIR